MVYITQFVYLKTDGEDDFNRYEALVLPLLNEYNGTLLHRIRCDKACRIDGLAAVPYEIHLLSFNSDADLEAFTNNPIRKEYAYLKENSVAETVLIKGEKI